MALLFSISACETMPTDAESDLMSNEMRNEMPTIAWPKPPAPARIEFIKAFSKPEDLNLRKPFSRKLRRILAGGDDRFLSRPYSIAVNNELIAVTDPGTAAVHLFDIEKKTYRTLSQAGEYQLVSPIGVALGVDRLFISDSLLNKVFILNKRLKLLATLEGFQRPTGLAFDLRRQRLYVADTLAHEIHVFGPKNERMEIIGERGEGSGQFNYPSHLAFAGDQLLVNDTMNFRVQIFNAEGEYMKTFGKHGNEHGFFAQSKGVAVDSDGNVYVADALTNQIQIFDPNGQLLLGFGGPGSDFGTFQMPAGTAIWNDMIYVSDSHNGRVQVFRYLPGGP
jgi:DNA-binding beta-propeller fold protein YncE